MDEFIAQTADSHRNAARIHLAWKVEQTVQSLGLMDYFVDYGGNGPFIQTIQNIERGYRA